LNQKLKENGVFGLVDGLADPRHDCPTRFLGEATLNIKMEYSILLYFSHLGYGTGEINAMKRITFALVSLLAITGCSHSSGTNPGDSSNASTPSSQPTTGKTEAKPFGRAPAISKADPTTPLTSYTAPTDQSWLTYIYVSRQDPQPSDEEKMKLFSAAYYHESDTFKKHDILVSGLPKVNSTLAEYQAQNYYVIQSENPYLYLKPYNFNTQSFQIDYCTSADSSPQGVSLRLKPSPDMCDLKVTDTSLARTIEDLRAHNALLMKFTKYFFVDGVDANRNEVEGTITHLHVDFVDSQSHRVVDSLDLN
jgi:hypothetical protein